MPTGNPKPRKRARALPARNAFAFTIEDGQAMGRPGRTTIYEMEKAGRLKFIHVGGRTMITGDSLRALLGVDEEVAA
jgi:predicted PhzF superfamily epimerase YddE/YHI9